MKIFLSKISFAIVLFVLIGNSNLFAQCTTAVEPQYPSSTVTPTCNGSPYTITTLAWTSEYSVLNLQAGVTYTFNSSVATDYLTIATDPGNVPQVFGTAPVVFNCAVSGNYRFYRHNDATCAGEEVLRTVTVTCLLPPPVNDPCTGALPISCGDVVTGSTSNATSEADGCFDDYTSNGVWYTFTGTGQAFTISLCGSGYDTYLSLYSGPDCSNLTCINSSDDDAACGPFALQSQLTDVPTVAGTQYWILVKGYNTASGNYNLSLTVDPYANDDCSGAIAIGSGTTSGSTSCSGVDAVAAVGTATAPTAGGVWYKYTTACSGNITMSLCSGTTYNSQISVYSGACGSLVGVDGNDDACGTQSSVTFAGTGGTTYYVLVHGNGTEEGDFDLNITQVDNVAPVADVDPLPTISSGCSITSMTAPTATDNCAGALTATTTDPTSYTLNGTYSVDWTYDDGNGNLTTQTQTVIINDATPPAINCVNDTTLSNDGGVCGAVVDYIVYATDDCPSNIFMTQNLDQSIQSGLIVSCPTAPNEWMRVFDVPAGMSLDSVRIAVGETVGTIPIAINIYSLSGPLSYANLTLLGSFPSSVPNVTAGSPIYVDVATPLVIPPATTMVVGFSYPSNLWPAGNTAGQTGIAYIAAPVCGAPEPTDPMDFVPAITDQNILMNVYGSSNAVDPSNVVQTAGLPSGSVFPVGTTTNSFTATDAAGNTSTCSFDVTVNDDENPVQDLDSSIVYNFSSTTVPVAIVNESVVMDSVLVTVIPTSLASGDLASVCIDIDHSYDNDISIDLISPSGTILSLSSNNGGEDDDYTGTCFDMNAATNITSGAAPFVGSYIPEGAGGFDVFNGEDPNGYWKIMITDGISPDAGSLNEFHMNFDFHWDTILPVLHNDCSTITAPTATDNCDGTLTATTSDPTSYDADGTYLITWTYTDGAGNSFVQTQEVIVDDVTPPVPTAGFIPPSSASCTYTVESIPTAIDGCTGDTIDGTTLDALTYNVAGTYTIVWTYDDGNGNTSTQTQTVTVTDTQDPVPTQTILPNVVGNCTVTVSTIPTATDNCSGTINGTTTDPLVYNVVGTFFITWTYTDVNGNTHTQNQTVIVNPCLGIENESGEWNALVYPNPGSGVFTLTLSEMPTENTEIKLVDGLGQVLYSGMLQNQTQQFDFSHLASATYYLLITNNNGHISKPIIIRHNY